MSQHIDYLEGMIHEIPDEADDYQQEAQTFQLQFCFALQKIGESYVATLVDEYGKALAIGTSIVSYESAIAQAIERDSYKDLGFIKLRLIGEGIEGAA